MSIPSSFPVWEVGQHHAFVCEYSLLPCSGSWTVASTPHGWFLYRDPVQWSLFSPTSLSCDNTRVGYRELLHTHSCVCVLFRQSACTHIHVCVFCSGSLPVHTFMCVCFVQAVCLHTHSCVCVLFRQSACTHIHVCVFCQAVCLH